MLFAYPALLITAIAILSAAVGVWLTTLSGLSRRLVPFGGGVLLGVALFWVLPEMAEFFSWQGAILWLTGGFLLLAAVDRYVYPVCQRVRILMNTIPASRAFMDSRLPFWRPPHCTVHWTAGVL